VGTLPGGSGNGPLILAHSGGPGTLQLSARQPGQSKILVSFQGCSERLSENPKIANRVPTGGQDRAPAKHSGPTSVSIRASPKGQVPTGPSFHTVWRVVRRPYSLVQRYLR